MFLFTPNVEKLALKKDLPGLVGAAQLGFKKRDTSLCLKAISALGRPEFAGNYYDLIQIAEEALVYFPEQHEAVTVAVFTAVGQTQDPQALLPIVRFYASLASRPATYIPNDLNDPRYRAFVETIKRLERSADKHLATYLMNEIVLVETKEIGSEYQEADEVKIAALEVLGVIGDLQDAEEIEKISVGFSENVAKQGLFQACKLAIEKIQNHYDALHQPKNVS
jgi:hypothetical protein